MKKNMLKDVLVTGFAMFAIFFGSGNLIFPPQVGLLSGEYVFWAIGGLAISAILFPMLAVAAVGNVGYGIQDMMKHVLSVYGPGTFSSYFRYHSQVRRGSLRDRF